MGQLVSPWCSLPHAGRWSLLVGVLILFSPDGALAQLDRAASDIPAIEPRPEPLQPRQPRSEAEEDRIAASAWYTQARLLHRRGEKAAALRAYQRAWRSDPQATTILSEIVLLAFELKRSEEAARYAVIAAEANPTDAVLVRRLALHLADERKWDRAVRLYERSLELQPEMKQVTDLGSAVLHQEMGRLYFLSDQPSKSAASFTKVRDALVASPSPLDEQSREVVLGNNPADTYSLWAESFLAANRFDEALALFEKASETQTDAPRLALQRARVEAARGDTAKALERLNEFFDAGGDSPTLEPYSLLASLLEKGDSEKQQARAALLARLQELHAKRPDDAALACYLAEQWIAAGRLADAEPLLVKTLDRQPTSEGYRQLVGLYRQQRKASPLAKLLGEVVKKTGSLRAIDEELAAIAGDAPLVADLLQSTRQQLADDPKQLAERQLFAHGLLALEAQQWDAAEEMFKAQIQADASAKSDVLLTWGLALYLADQYERAIRVFQQIIDEQAFDDNEAAVRLSLAGALELSGKTDEALAAVRQAMEMYPQSATVQARAGWILYHAKRYDEAAKTYRELIAAHDGRHDSASLRDTLREARLALSSVLLAQDKFDEAVELLEQVLDEYPEDAGALNDLGYLWCERGLHLERSLRMTQQAVAAEPDNASFRDSLGWAYYQLGRYGDAVRELEQAAAGDGPGGVVLEHLGDAYAKAGQAEKARLAWERAAQAFQQEAETEKLEALRRKVAEHMSE